MGLAHSPKIVTDGLVFAYDMANTKKSWKGSPTINLLQNPTPSGTTTGYGASGGTGTLTYNPDNQAIKWVRNTYETWGAYHTINPMFNGNLDTASQYTISFEWKTDNTAISNSAYSYNLVQGNGASAAASANLLSNSTLLSNGWFLFKYTFFPANTGISAFNRVIMGAQGTNVSTFYWRKVQFEKTGFATPFVDGTRSNTQAVVDLIGNNTITANSLTYNSDGTFSFNGNSNTVTIPNPITPTAPYSVMQWIRAGVSLPDTTNSASRKTPLAGPGPVWNPGYWLTGRVFRVHANTEYRDVTINWVNDLSWHQVGQIYDGITCYTIIDGQILLGTRTAYAPSSPATVLIGSEVTAGNAQSWNGNIGVTKFYNRALSATEVQQNFNALRGRYGI